MKKQNRCGIAASAVLVEYKKASSRLMISDFYAACVTAIRLSVLAAAKPRVVDPRPP
jgi:hypothetical protein